MQRQNRIVRSKPFRTAVRTSSTVEQYPRLIHQSCLQVKLDQSVVTTQLIFLRHSGWVPEALQHSTHQSASKLQQTDSSSFQVSRLEQSWKVLLHSDPESRQSRPQHSAMARSWWDPAGHSQCFANLKMHSHSAAQHSTSPESPKTSHRTSNSRHLQTKTSHQTNHQENQSNPDSNHTHPIHHHTIQHLGSIPLDFLPVVLLPQSKLTFFLYL